MDTTVRAKRKNLEYFTFIFLLFPVIILGMDKPNRLFKYCEKIRVRYGSSNYAKELVEELNKNYNDHLSPTIENLQLLVHLLNRMLPHYTTKKSSQWTFTKLRKQHERLYRLFELEHKSRSLQRKDLLISTKILNPITIRDAAQLKKDADFYSEMEALHKKKAAEFAKKTSE